MTEMIELPVKLYVITVMLLMCNSVGCLLRNESDIGDFVECVFSGGVAIWLLQYVIF